MAEAIDTGGRVFELGNVFSRAFGVMGGSAATVFGVSFLLGAVPQAVWSYVLPQLVGGMQPGNFGPAMAVSVVGGLIMLLLNMVVQGALVRITIGYGEGQSVTLGQSINTGVTMFLPLAGLAILTLLGMLVGIMLLVVPGIILALMWAVAGPALVAERGGIIASLARSRSLTKGARWKILGLILLLVVIMWVILAIVAVVAIGGSGGIAALAAEGRNPTVLMTVIGLISNTVLIAFWSTMFNALFVELRNWKDGLAPNNLADVFA